MEISEGMYKELLLKAPVGLALNRLDGTFVEVNEALAKITGYSGEELRRMTYWDITPAEYTEEDALRLESLRTHGRYGPYEKEYLHKNGYRIPVVLSGVLIESEEGEKLIWSTVDNVTDLKNGEKLLQKAQQMANIGHWNLDLQKNELTWSDETYRIFGLKPQEFRATYDAFVERIYPDDRDAVNNAYTRSIEQREPYEIDHRVIRPDGEIRYVHERCEHRYDQEGNIIGSIGTVLDVTERFESEKELIAAKEKAEAANDAKSNFIANISHELRTPMNAILGFSNMIAKDGNLTPEQQKSLSIINSAGTHLLAMINEILDLSRIESGEMGVDYETFELTTLLDEIRALMQVKAKEKNLRCNLVQENKIPAYIRSDKNKMRQVLTNLIGNAIKFTEEGVIGISVTFVENKESSGGDLRIDISDTGCGIKASMLEKVFEPFVQDSVSKDGGTGLGLSISKKIVLLLGGSISVESTEGKGSVFHLQIPIEKAGPMSTAHLEVSRRVIGLQPGQREFKVLVVDDTPTNRILSASLLRRAGFNVEEAINGSEAVELFGFWKPDLILMDVRMPGMNGYEAMDAIRSLPGGERVKIILLSAHVLQEEYEERSHRRSDGFLGKPFELAQLLEMIGNLLGVRYAYKEESAGESADPRLESTSMEEIPEPFKAAIRDAALKGNGKALKKAIEAIEEEFGPVAEYLKRLSAKYDFDAVVALLER